MCTHAATDFAQQLASATITIDGPLSGAENMRRDEALVAHLLSNPGDFRMYIRFYQWQPWCISLGYHQPLDDLNLEALAERGFEWVRRPTGGRAVLHAHELTYAFALRLSEGVSPQDIYRWWHQWLAAALQYCLGIEGIVFARTQDDFIALLRQEPTRWLCFASSARSELVWRGRKLVGSAQRLWGDVLLQHGSLLLGSGHEQLPYCLRQCPNPEAIAAYLQRRSVTLAEICRQEVSFEHLAHALAHARTIAWHNTPDATPQQLHK